MPMLFIIVANARWECLRLGNFLLRRAVLEVSRRLILGRVTLQRLDEEDWEVPGVFFLTKWNFLLNPLLEVKLIYRFLSFCAFLMASS
jgi:hypothetical protein